MQRVQCDVSLDGDRNHVVHKTNLTVAEVVVLQHVHGADSVNNIKHFAPQDRRSHAEEVERLKGIYNRRNFRVTDVFPGVNPQLPVKLADIGIKEQAEPKTKGGGKGGNKQATSNPGQVPTEPEGTDDAGATDANAGL